MPIQPPPHTIDEVLLQLDQLIFTCRQENSRLGFFATLYRNVTIKIKEGIAAGIFDDGPRMERLDVAFANRYLAAIEGFRQHQPLSSCWRVAFQTAANRKIAVISGSLPPGVPIEACAALVSSARSANCLAFVDSSGAALSKALAA